MTEINHTVKKVRKRQFKLEDLDYFCEIIFQKPLLDMVGQEFSVQSLKESNALEKFRKTDMLNYLLKFLKTSQCTILKKTYEEITELNLIRILYNIFKRFETGYTIKYYRTNENNFYKILCEKSF